MAENGAVSLKVDGREVEVPAGTLAVEAARRAGVEIPVFCYHPRLDPVGMCRMCLVEIGTPVRGADGSLEMGDSGEPAIRMMPRLQPACTTIVSQGMVLVTDSPAAAEAQRGVLELLLTSHPLDCPICDKGGECPLQELTYSHGPGKSRFRYGEKFQFQKPVPLGSLIYLDRERCILCARCTRFQDEIAGHPVLAMASRGRGMEIVTFSDPPFDSKFSGNTVDICPVGALTSADFRFRARPWELDNRPAVCPHCPVGCNLTLGIRTGTVRRIVPRVNEAVNEEWICDKGRFAHHYLRSDRRVTTPLVRRNGSLEPATWEEALSFAAEGLRRIRDEAGPAAMGGIGSIRTSNEANYLFQKLFRAVLGSNHVDHRLEGGWRQEELPGLWRSQVPHGTIAAMGRAGTILAVGGDLSEAQPVLELRVKKALRQGARLVVASPRLIELARMADVWIPYRPGGEIGALGGILRQLVEDGQIPVEPTPELLRSLRYFSARRVTRSVGVEPDTLSAAARLLRGGEGLAILADEKALDAG
ncbi:MAG: NADH-quinone oxidoreductase subunit NuoG, partial [Anaerolineae bacterium]